MNKGILTLIGIAIVAVYLVLGFLNKMDTSSELSTVEQKIQKEDMTYYRKDAIGQTVLYFSGMPYEKKFAIWKRSPIHEEFFALFPNFMAMKDFVNDRVSDPDFKDTMVTKIDDIETAYFSGKIDDLNAKEMLDQE